MKTLLSLHIATALTVMSTVLFAAPPHVHGAGTLQLVLEGSRLNAELRLPAINVVGFEHAPSDTKQEEAVKKAVALLRDSRQVLTPSEKAQCTAAPGVVASALLLEHGQADHDHDDHDEAHDDDHADFDVRYGFDCRRPEALKQIKVRLFQPLPKLERLDVEMVTATGQARQRLVPGQAVITLP
ncbi:MAG: DUF2796 domain-containing protein [Gammaproteobacteria bacterium]|nr:DUF2796 domain-containing protein [Gammaproteobacteria bacterium]